MSDVSAEAIDKKQWNEGMGASFQGRTDITEIEIIERTEGYNGADVEEVCRTAKMSRICMIDSGDGVKEVTKDNLDYALTRIRSSVSKKDLKDIEDYRRGGTPGYN